MPEQPLSLTVRQARPDELDRAGEVAGDAYAAGGSFADGDDGYDAIVRDAAARAAHGPVLVAEDSEGIVGTVTITPPGSEFSELAGPDETEFRFLAVDRRAWGRGVADALVAAVVERAARSGSSRVVCFVITWNGAAHRLYERHGFLRAPARDWEPVPGILLLAYELPV